MNGAHIRGSRGAFIKTLITSKVNHGLTFKPGETVVWGKTPHTHEASTETFYILSGEARCRVGDEETILKAGHRGYAPTGVSHAVHNIGQEDLHAISIFNPPPG